MANLAQTIKTNTGLAQMSAEELAAQQGRAPSRQPLETAVLGGTKDQAKMAGTPAQKSAALRTGIQDQEDLATTLRRGQARTEQTEAEKQQITKAGQLAGLGGLGERVAQMAEANLAAVAATEPGSLEVLEGTDPEIAAHLQTIRDFKPDSAQSIAAVQAIETKLGRDVTATELSTYYGTQEEQLEQDLVVDAIETGELPLQDFGFENIEELAGLLGVDSAELSQMNMEDFHTTLNNVIQEEYTRTANLQAAANDPRLGAKQQAEARAELRDLGFVGIVSAESEIDQLADEFEQDTQIEFGGETFSIDELLSSEKISGLVAGYLQGLDKDGNPVTEEAKEFKEKHPELAEFAIKYQGQFEDAVANLDASIIAESQLADKNAGYATPVEGGTDISNAITQIFPGFGKEAVTYDYMDRIQQDVPGLATLYSDVTSESQKVNATERLSTFADSAPSGFTQALLHMSQDELEGLGFYAPPGDPRWVDFTAKMEQANKIDSLDTESTSAVASMFGAADGGEFEQTLKDLQTAFNAGLISEDKMPQIPGLLEGDWDQVKDWLQDNAAPRTFQEVLNSSTDSLSNQYADWKSTAGVLDTADMMISAFENDNVVDSAEISSIIKENKDASLQDLAIAIDSLEDDQFADETAIGVAEQALKTAATEEIYSILAEDAVTKNIFTGDMTAFLESLRQDEINATDYQLVRAQIAALGDIPGVEDKVKSTLEMMDEWMAKPSDIETQSTSAGEKIADKLTPEEMVNFAFGQVSKEEAAGIGQGIAAAAGDEDAKKAIAKREAARKEREKGALLDAIGPFGSLKSRGRTGSRSIAELLKDLEK